MTPIANGPVAVFDMTNTLSFKAYAKDETANPDICVVTCGPWLAFFSRVDGRARPGTERFSRVEQWDARHQAIFDLREAERLRALEAAESSLISEAIACTDEAQMRAIFEKVRNT